MKTFLVIELFVMYQLFVIGFLVMVAKDVIGSIKKHKKGKRRRTLIHSISFNRLGGGTSAAALIFLKGGSYGRDKITVS
jgi:hypothetical protein